MINEFDVGLPPCGSVAHVARARRPWPPASGSLSRSQLSRFRPRAHDSAAELHLFAYRKIGQPFGGRLVLNVLGECTVRVRWSVFTGSADHPRFSKDSPFEHVHPHNCL